MHPKPITSILRLGLLFGLVLLTALSVGAETQSGPQPGGVEPPPLRATLALKPIGPALETAAKAEIGLVITSVDEGVQDDFAEETLFRAVALWDAQQQRSVARFDLPTGGVWSVALDDAAHWLPPTRIWVTKDEPIEQELDLYAAAELTGRLRIPKGSAEPERLAVVLGSQVDEILVKRSPKRVSFECPVDEDLRFDCLAPAGQWDVRMSIPFHVPRYLWTHTIPVGEEKDFGQLPFRRGSSLAGWVVLPKGFEEKSAEVEIRVASLKADTTPARNPEAASWRERAKLQDFSTRPNSKGFFQLVGLPEGSFELEASLDPLGSERRSPIPIEEDSESSLFDPIELRPPARVEVFFAPPMAPDGLPWQLVLIDMNSRESIHQSTVDLGGSVVLESIHPGRYSLLASSGEGRFRTRWHAEVLEIDSDTSEHWIEIDVVPIEGRVLRGGEPAKAQLWFGGQDRAPSIAIDTDSEGEFSGALDRAGQWEVDVAFEDGMVRAVEPVEVITSDDGSPAWVEVEIPQNRIYGRVLLSNGKPADSAVTVLMLSLEHGRKISEVRCDEEGLFSIESFRPGSVWLVVRAPEGSSQPREFLVEADEEQGPIELRLEAQRKYRGLLLSEGRPVSGATVGYQPAGRGPRSAKSATTRPDGTFEFRAPVGSRSVDMLFIDNSRAATLRRVALPVDGVGTAGGEGEENGGVPIEIEISRHGGLLELDGGGRSSREISLFVDGVEVPQFSTLIRSYRKLTGVAVDFSKNRLPLPRMAAGFYVLCGVQFPDSAAMDLIEARGIPMDCEGGYLPRFGSLGLSLPEPEEEDPS